MKNTEFLDSEPSIVTEADKVWEREVAQAKEARLRLDSDKEEFEARRPFIEAEKARVEREELDVRPYIEAEKAR